MSALSKLQLTKNGVPISDMRLLMLMVGAGEFSGLSQAHVFGRNDDVNGTMAPISVGGVYQTPTAAVTLALISDDADDTAAGTGAQEVTLTYLDANFEQQTATIATNGLTESTETVEGVLRLLGACVTKSGTYASQTAPSQQGTITIRVESAGATWAVIPEIGTSGFAVGCALIGAYTVPAGKTAYLLSASMAVDSNKTADFYFSARENADDIITPFSGVWHMHHIYVGVVGAITLDHFTFEAYPEKTDIGFLGTAATSADASAGFELLLIDN